MRRKILSTILLALVLLMSIGMAVPKGFCIIVNHKDVVSNNDCFTVTVYVHQDLDSMATKDFFAFWMRVHAHDSVYDFVWVTIETVEGTCDVWEPKGGVSLGGAVRISIGYISIGVNLIPLSLITVDGEYTNTISWFFDAQDVDDAEFAAGFWVPEGSPLHFTVTVRAAYYVPPLSFPVWDDTAIWSSTTRPQLSISASYGGTTNPTPGTYTYAYGSSETVWASATSSHYKFSYWLLDGATAYDNPKTVIMYSDHTLEAHFSFYNNAPDRPSLTGLTSGYVGETYTYTVRATDPDGDKIKYTFYWRDGTSTTTGFYSSGDYVSRSHSWGSAKTYYVYVKATDYYGAYKSSYTLTVTISVNNPPNTPSKPSGPASGYVGYSYTYSTSTTDPDLDRVRYKFSWGDGSYTDTGYYSSGATVYASHKWSTTGYKDVKVKAYDGYAWSGSSSLTVYIHYAAGCPMLYVYDGSEYVEEGLLDIHNPEGVDVVYEHTLASTPERVDGAYLMRLTEHPQTHSYIDQVKLYAILEDGTMKELPLIWAWHSEDGNVLPQLLHSDEWKADTLGADHNNGVSQSIDLKFAALSPNLEITGFVFQIEGNNAIIK